MDVPEREVKREKVGKKQGLWQLENIKQLSSKNIDVNKNNIAFYTTDGVGERRLVGFIYPGYASGQRFWVFSALSGEMYFQSDLLPFTPRIYDLGSTLAEWRRIYLTTSPIVSSDVRFKKDIETIAYGLAEVEKLSPIKYKREDDERTQLGFSAQELKEIIPEMVLDENDTLSITPDALLPVLVNAVKELSARVKALEEKVV